MKLRTLVCVVVWSLAELKATPGAPLHLRCQYLENPLGIDSSTPQLSWENESSERNWEQSAYQILVASSPQQLDASNPDVWDSHKVASSESVGILYRGPKLESRQRYFWKVRVWSTHGDVSESSEAASWEMGLLAPHDWKAHWISWQNPDAEADRAGIRWIWVSGQNAMEVAPQTTAVFRTKLVLSEKPFDAELSIAVRGDYVAAVNGHEVGRKSEWRSFDRRDITEELVTGENIVEIRVTSPN